MHEQVTISRDVESIEIPSGRSVVLFKGTPVALMQSLGGSHTVMTADGFMARIAEIDADAIGKEKPVDAAEAAGLAPGEVPNAEVLEKLVWGELRTCYDPEIPVNIVELGLVYECRLVPVEGGFTVEIRLTLTAPGCGMGQVLQSDIERKLRALPGVKAVNVQLVFDPPWDREMMSEAARLELGLL